MKAIDLTEGQRIVFNGQQGTVVDIQYRVWFRVDTGRGKPRTWFVDGSTEIETAEQEETLFETEGSGDDTDR
jgi:hypothetical protein